MQAREAVDQARYLGAERRLQWLAPVLDEVRHGEQPASRYCVLVLADRGHCGSDSGSVGDGRLAGADTVRAVVCTSRRFGGCQQMPGGKRCT